MGRIFRFDKDVDTDQIIASQYLLYPTIDEMKAHTFESLDSEFAAKVQPGRRCPDRASCRLSGKAGQHPVCR